MKLNGKEVRRVVAVALVIVEMSSISTIIIITSMVDAK